MALSYNEKAAQLMEHLCNHDSHGYSQPNRKGTGEIETVTLSDGSSYPISLGDRDCSSAVIDAWETVCPGSTGKATYTGNMRSEFVKTGMFVWHPNGDGYEPKRGDLYLNESRHTAMYLGNGKLGEFSISETNGITGQTGDQNGWESHIRDVYNYSAGWDGILAYVGKDATVDNDEKVDSMAKVFVICGHGEGDSGAVGGGYTEANLVRELAGRMKKLGGDAVQVGDTSKNWYADNLISKGWCPAGVPVIELHMDSASASARGGHVIIKSGFAADSIDNALARFISSFFPGRSNSIVGRSDLANVNRAAKMGVNYRLVENGFISNDGDRNKFINQMDDLARGILNCFGISASTPTPEPEPKPKPPLPDALKGYTDLDSEAWYVDAIECVVKNHWMSGYSSTTFGPNDVLTRAQAVCVIANVAGMESDEPFEDVKASPFYYKAVEWAEENGIVNGNDGKFYPENPCSRQDFACMLHNYLDKPAPKGQPTEYSDWSDVADYAKDAVAWCVEQGIISGFNGKLNPTNNCTRAECAGMLYNADKAGLI